jgi:uncharacterized protein (DUF2249 family)/hemerythrin-like domain-containing protein
MTIVAVETLDLRNLPEGAETKRVAQALDALADGGGVMLLSEEDPKSVQRGLLNERPGAFDWSVLEASRGRWRILVSKRAAGTENERSVFEYLGWDHDRLDGLFQEACRHVEDGRPAAAAQPFAEFRTGLLRHIRMEEEVLFPAFEELTGFGAAGPTTVMRIEHIEIQSVLDRMCGWIASPGDPAGFRAMTSQLEAVLGGHNEKEEHVVYPMTDRSLPPHQRAELVVQMQMV